MNICIFLFYILKYYLFYVVFYMYFIKMASILMTFIQNKQIGKE